MARIWVLAFLLSSLTTIGVLQIFAPKDRIDSIRSSFDIDGASGVMIGTSRMGAAVPHRLTTNGSELRRFAVSGASAALELQIAELALDQGATEVVIELQPFVRALKHNHRQIVLGKELRQATSMMFRSNNVQPTRWIEDRRRSDREILAKELKRVYPPPADRNARSRCLEAVH